jgi:putative tryptophan/tyrosine transport system substrate-binding protein
MNRREMIAALGGAAAWPIAAGAQQAAMPVIGFMSARSPDDSAPLVEAFRRGLEEGGFVEGRNVAIEFRWAHGDYNLLPTLAADLVRHQVAVITAVGGEPSAAAAKQATSSIPIVFGIGGDPISSGLVESFSHPGGNMTGVTLLSRTIDAKRLGLLRELAPGARVVGVLANPNYPLAALQLRQIEQAAQAIGQEIVLCKASTDGELEAAFAALARERVGALLVAADTYFTTRRDRIVTFAAQTRLPAIYDLREFAAAGGILSYSVRIADAYLPIGIYTARVLNGAKPADLPVQQATNFELVINLKTAKALGIVISDNLLSLADEVIE